MKLFLAEVLEMLRSDGHRDRVVPATGASAILTSFTSGAMAFLIVFALALSSASQRLADRWSNALAGTATVRISAPADQLDGQVARVLEILKTTPGIAEARSLTTAEEQALLEPWFGPDIPLDGLPVPRLIELRETSAGYDGAGLRLRLSAEAPGAVLDDHNRWRTPLVRAANRLSWLARLAIVTIGATSAAMVILAARAALSANKQVITVLRLVGARDVYIVAAFVRRFALRAIVGAAVGSLIGAIALFLLPAEDVQASILTGLRFQGAEWLWLIVVPPLLGLVAFGATRYAANSVLKGLS